MLGGGGGGGDCGPGTQSSEEEEAGSSGKGKAGTQRQKSSRKAWHHGRKETESEALVRRVCLLNSPETTKHEDWGAQVRGNPGPLEQQRIKEMDQGNS